MSDQIQETGASLERELINPRQIIEQINKYQQQRGESFPDSLVQSAKDIFCGKNPVTPLDRLTEQILADPPKVYPFDHHQNIFLAQKIGPSQVDIVEVKNPEFLRMANADLSSLNVEDNLQLTEILRGQMIAVQRFLRAPRIWYVGLTDHITERRPWRNAIFKSLDAINKITGGEHGSYSARFGIESAGQYSRKNLMTAFDLVSSLRGIIFERLENPEEISKKVDSIFADFPRDSVYGKKGEHDLLSIREGETGEDYRKRMDKIVEDASKVSADLIRLCLNHFSKTHFS